MTEHKGKNVGLGKIRRLTSYVRRHESDMPGQGGVSTTERVSVLVSLDPEREKGLSNLRGLKIQSSPARECAVG